MNVMYTCDNNYLWLMGISMISLFENNAEVKDIVVYLLGNNISIENQKLLQQIANNYKRKVEIVNISKIDIPKELLKNRWPLSAFFRLYSGMYLPKKVNKVLYLDCDTIVNDNLEKLLSIRKNEFDEKIFFGVKDCISKNYRRNIGLNESDNYINAGMLVINVDNLRKINVNSELENFMKEYKNYIYYADQDLLNGTFKNSIGVVDAKYDVMTLETVNTYEEIIRLRKPSNYYSKEELINATNNPAIIHYTSNMRVIRPWFKNTNHPYANLFKKYYKMSPWNNKKLSNFTFKTNESKLIKYITFLPKNVSYSLLGFLHSKVKPNYIYYKAKIKKR